MENNNIEINEKKKKGRPKNEKEKEYVEKKKRGRKKKEVVPEDTVVKQKKKRGRKAAIKFFSSSIRKHIPLSTSLQDTNNILHIDINENDENDEIINVSDTQAFGNILDEYPKIDYNDKNILLEFIDNSDLPLRDLYENIIENREKQDKLLIDNFDVFHKSKPIIKEENNIKPKEVTNIQEENRKQGYFQMFNTFIENKEWLKYTDACCWWCCNKFETLPLGLPVDYNIYTNKFRVKGIFCSFPCIMAYNKSCNINNKPYLIKHLYKKLTGTQLLHTKLQIAPCRYTLKMFGGELSIEEFRNSTTQHKLYKMIDYPMVMSRDYVEEIDISTIKNANTSVFDNTVYNKVLSLDNKRVNDAKLRINTEKNSNKSSINTLDDFINSK